MYVFCDLIDDWVFLENIIKEDCPYCPNFKNCRDFNIDKFEICEKED